MVAFPVIGFQLCPTRSSECRFIALVYWTHAGAFELSSRQSWRRLCKVLYPECTSSIRVTGALITLVLANISSELPLTSQLKKSFLK